MDAEFRAVLERLDRGLWPEIFGPDEAIVPTDTAALRKRFKAFVTSHQDEPPLIGLRRPTRKGPGALVAGKLKPIEAEWIRTVPDQLDRLVAQGLALRGTLAGSARSVYLLRPEAAIAMDWAAQATRLHALCDTLRGQIVGLESIARLLVPDGARPAGGPSALDGPAPRGASSEESCFKAAYDRLDPAGRGYVDIHKVRRALGWDRDRFELALAALRKELKIDLHVGDPGDYDDDSVVDSYVEEDGTLYLTVSWRG
ncbi:MAG: hypothetical protein HY815_09405 [Candidatus Riflebacteria bacterium]|nr:hypothetical protein [Candidatus Riflebacteria bacterium]